ncbi:MAG: glycosyltransferase family 9 protein [Alphaproteobacteria bacterium]|nr:glycosyltransferase family 9 protein [Alphaproteobacteria bacterium]
MTTSAAVPKHTISVRLYDPPTAEGRNGLKILLLKLDHIGDFITALDAFRLMREAFPKAEITLMCLPATVAMAESTGLFDRIVGFTAEQNSPQLGKVPKMDIEDKIARFQTLLNGPYFLAADFKHDVFEQPWLDYVEAECRAGFARETEKGLDIVMPAMDWHMPTTSHANPPVHAATRLTLLAQLIIDALFDKPLPADLFRAPEGLESDPAYGALKAEKRLKIGLSLGAGAELRQWPDDYWAQLTAQLARTHKPMFVFFGGNGDKPATRALIEKLPPGSCLDLTGGLPLAQLPAYMGLLDAYIGCDTGPTHLAARLGLPTVNIFAGVSGPAIWRTRGPKVKTVYAEVLCAPCHLRFMRECQNGHVCLKAILPPIVHACFEQLVPAVGR